MECTKRGWGYCIDKNRCKSYSGNFSNTSVVISNAYSRPSDFGRKKVVFPRMRLHKYIDQNYSQEIKIWIKISFFRKYSSFYTFLILKLELQKGQVIINQFTQQKWQPFWWLLIGSRKYSEWKVGKAISGSQCWHVDLPQKGLWFFITGVSNSVPGWVRFQPCSNTQSL